MAKLAIGILLLGLWFLPMPVNASSGGRSGGGSFERTQPKDRAPSSPSRPRENYNRSYDDNYYYDSSSGSSDSSSVGLLEGLIIITFLMIAGGIAAMNPRLLQSGTESSPVLPTDVRNNRVTISKIQIALYATARSLQREIRQLSESANFNTKEGLRHFLREALIILQRNSDAWCYALGHSEVCDRDKAIEKFDILSTEERVKFSAETFSRMADQRVIRKDYVNEEEVPEFIIVTVLIGTEHDKPLFPPIKNRDDVGEAIRACLGITATYLLTVELLWTPESDRDSLTKDDLNAKYSDLIAL